MLFVAAHRADQHTAGRQLFQQPGRYLHRGCSRQDGIERPGFFPAYRTICVAKEHIVMAQQAHALARLVEQRLYALNAVDLAGQLGQDRRLVTGARTDFSTRVRGPRDSSNSDIRATVYGCDKVWLKPIGSASSS